ncbi:MAG TPA: hypothetical protein VJ302_20145, partial [Blastocatellia bacterium]|nr:hypothetical protein [Blastocatellia bacterium]
TAGGTTGGLAGGAAGGSTGSLSGSTASGVASGSTGGLSSGSTGGLSGSLAGGSTVNSWNGGAGVAAVGGRPSWEVHRENQGTDRNPPDEDPVAASEAKARTEQAEIEFKSRIRTTVPINKDEDVDRMIAQTVAKSREIDERYRQIRGDSKSKGSARSAIRQTAWQMSHTNSSAIALRSRVESLLFAFRNRPKLVGFGVIIFLLVVALMWIGGTIYLLIQG